MIFHETLNHFNWVKLEWNFRRTCRYVLCLQYNAAALIFHLQNLLAVKEYDTCSTSHFLIQLYPALVNKQCPLCDCILLTHSLCLCHPPLCIPFGLQFCAIFAFPNWHLALASIHQLIPCLFPLLQHHLNPFLQSTKFLVWVIRWVHYLLCLTLCVRVTRFQRRVGE